MENISERIISFFPMLERGVWILNGIASLKHVQTIECTLELHFWTSPIVHTLWTQIMHFILLPSRFGDFPFESPGYSKVECSLHKWGFECSKNILYITTHSLQLFLPFYNKSHMCNINGNIYSLRYDEFLEYFFNNMLRWTIETIRNNSQEQI